MKKITDTFLKNLKHTPEKSMKIFDGNGLFLFVTKKGAKSWRIKYRFDGKEKLITLGLYPEVTLIFARQEALRIKQLVKDKIDPAFRSKVEEDEDCLSFQEITEEWLEIRQSDKTARHIKDTRSKIDRYLYPFLKDRKINDIKTKEVTNIFLTHEKKGIYPTIKKVKHICNQIFTYAVAKGVIENNPCFGLTLLAKAPKAKHFAYLSDRRELAELLKLIDTYPYNPCLKKALQIIPHIFVRPSELINAKWSEVNFEDRIWIIPEERMKMDRKHLVPLSKQVISHLKELYEITGHDEFLFANWNKRGKPLSIEGVRKGLVILGYKDKMTTHGFRHTASTLLNELGYNRDWIEMQLAHSQNSIRSIYNHAEYIKERTKMMQEWSDFLDELKSR